MKISVDSANAQKLKGEKRKMQIAISKTKATAIFTIILMMTSVSMMAISAQAQYGFWNPPPAPTNVQPNGSTALPAGVTADMTVDSRIALSFRPNPVGVGQTIIVNVWNEPPNAVTRYITGYKVVLTAPDGTSDTKTFNSYQADSTGWFEYVVDQVGTWTLQAFHPGAYWPAGNYSMPAGVGQAGYTESYTKSLYERPSNSPKQTLIVQNDPVLPWPARALPTDYWTRPVMFENREWAAIAGDYPWNGPGTSANWPADTNRYWSSRYTFVPYVQAPNTAHIAWKRVGSVSGLMGGDMGVQALTSGGGNPSIIFEGRAYQTVTKQMPTYVNGTIRVLPVSVWQCYDIRTGQVYWEQTDTTAPSNIEYAYGTPEVPGADARAGASATLLAISGNRLIKYNPTTGAVSTNVSIITTPALTTTQYYMNGYALSVQTISTTGNEDLTQHAGGTDWNGSATAGVYRLINWTTIGANTNFTTRIMSNISWPRSSLGVASRLQYRYGFRDEGV